MRKLFLPLLFCGLFCSALPALGAPDSLRVAGPAVHLAGGTDAAYVRPVWSPDGTRLAFTTPGYRGLFVMDLAGRTVQPVTDELAAGYGAAWSPDGAALLARVARFDGPRREDAVKVFDARTGMSRQLTEYRTSLDALPRWSADGARAYVAGRDGLEVFDTGRAPLASKAAADAPAFYLQNDRIAAARLTDATDVRLMTPFDDEATLLNLTPSPDGTRLAFEVVGGNLFVMDADGGGLVDLGPGHRPSWSPDGAWVVFMRTQDDGEQFTAADLYAARTDGSATVRLTDTPARLEMNPDWSPAGDAIAFDALDEGVLYLLPVAR